MNANPRGSWSTGIGHWLGLEVRIHLYLPLLSVSALLAAELLNFPLRVALVGILVLHVSVALHELARAFVASRTGGHTRRIVLGPTGGWADPDLPPDPPAHILTALAGPTTYLALCVFAGCLLALSGGTGVVALLSPFGPEFSPDSTALQLALELCVWVNSVLLLINLLPIGHCDGSALLRSLLWPLVDQTTASTAVRHLAFGASLATVGLAFWLRDLTVGASIPAWYPLSVLSLLLFYGSRSPDRHSLNGSARSLDEFDSDDDQWLSSEWTEDDRAAVVAVEPLQEKQQANLDRKRREREDLEDAEVDHILMRLQEVSFDDLSEEERAVLKRASRRYRRRLGSASNPLGNGSSGNHPLDESS